MCGVGLNQLLFTIVFTTKKKYLKYLQVLKCT